MNSSTGAGMWAKWAAFRQAFAFRLAAAPSQTIFGRHRKNWRFEFYQRYTRRFLSSLPSRIRLFDRRILLAATSAAGFSFADNGISDKRMEEAKESYQEFDHVDDLLKKGWEIIYEEKYLKVFRRRVKGPYEMYEYKCIGTYFDISPRNFLDVQNDLKYRKEWDKNVISLELLKEQDENELIRWVSKYPYPLYPREYIYARRTWVSEDEKLVVVDSEVIQPSTYPSTSNNVRVCTYTSRMIVRAHSKWQDDGLDYMLTYSDNPEANIPRYVYNWIVNQGGPYFLRQVHTAACDLEKSGRQLKSTMEHAKNAILQRKNREEEAERLKKEKQKLPRDELPKIVLKEKKEEDQQPQHKEEKKETKEPAKDEGKQEEEQHKGEGRKEKPRLFTTSGAEYADANANGGSKEKKKKDWESRLPVHADAQINAVLT